VEHCLPKKALFTWSALPEKLNHQIPLSLEVNDSITDNSSLVTKTSVDFFCEIGIKLAKKH